MKGQTKELVGNKAETRIEWFDQLIHYVVTDKQTISLDIATPATKTFWDTIIFGDKLSLMSMIRDKSTQAYISKLVVEYVNELRAMRAKPVTLLLDHNDSQVLVWAVINDDDDATEVALLKAEAKTNAKNHQYGFHISSTILEMGDNVPTPPHYKAVTLS